MPLSTPQQEIAESNTRFRVAICGRRFGKTYLAMRELARFAREPDTRVWFIAPTRLQGKGIVWQQLKDRFQDLRWLKRVNESELTITLVNGSTIQIMSADAYDRMRGYSVNFVVFDEFADMDEGVWTAVRPTLSDKQGHALFIGTPKGSYNWAKDIYDMSRSNGDWQSFQYTTLDGGNVEESEIENAKRDLDPKTFRQEYMATFEDAGNRVFYDFNSDNITAYSGDIDGQLFVGMDFNVSPMTASIGVRNGETLHLVDEIRMMSSSTEEMVNEIKQRYPNIRSDRISVFPDPAGAARKTSANGKTDHSILGNAGFRVLAPRKHDPVRDGINAVNARIKSADGVRHLLVDPRCKYTIESLERHSYKENTQTPDKDSGYDHMADAVRYMVSYLWPIRKETTPRPPQRWTHRTN